MLVPVLLAVSALVLAGCRDGGERAPSVPTTEAPTTTLGPPVALGSALALDLVEGQCYVEADDDDQQAATSTAAPTSDPVLVVDCGAGHDGEVYATTCLGPDPSGAPVAAPCPGDPAQSWPGDRTVRRAAVGWCLARFQEHFGEPYATSQRATAELTPTEGAWMSGVRRVVCAVRP